MKDRIVLDITRLYSRRHFNADTGIDRVERGLFSILSENGENVFLIRNKNSYFLLQSSGAMKILRKPKKGKVASYLQLRRHAIRHGNASINLQGYEAFFHLGHTRHPDSFWADVKKSGVKSHILIHDVIPLDFPETCRRDQLPVFKKNFSQWVSFADKIITPSKYSHDRILAHARPKAEIKIAPLYVEKMPMPNMENAENAFLCVGTIEPRKNHATLLNAWRILHQRLGDNCPKLWLIGARGWENDQVFEFLDKSPLMGKFVFEMGAVDDDALKASFARAKAILQPSLAEGFGLPFYEAAISGQSLLASDIPAFKEAIVKEDQKQLIHATSVEEWANKVEKFKPNQFQLDIKIPANWEEYFKSIS